MFAEVKEELRRQYDSGATSLARNQVARLLAGPPDPCHTKHVTKQLRVVRAQRDFQCPCDWLV